MSGQPGYRSLKFLNSVAVSFCACAGLNSSPLPITWIGLAGSCSLTTTSIPDVAAKDAKI